MDTVLCRAIELAGGPTKLAAKLTALGSEITKSAISQWERCPPNRVLAVEEAVGGAVTRYELRPDIYGDPPPATRKKVAA